MVTAEADAKRAYKMWVRRMDLYGQDNYPKWTKTSARHKRAWLIAVEVVRELEYD